MVDRLALGFGLGMIFSAVFFYVYGFMDGILPKARD